MAHFQGQTQEWSDFVVSVVGGNGQKYAGGTIKIEVKHQLGAKADEGAKVFYNTGGNDVLKWQIESKQYTDINGTAVGQAGFKGPVGGYSIPELSQTSDKFSIEAGAQFSVKWAGNNQLSYDIPADPSNDNGNDIRGKYKLLFRVYQDLGGGNEVDVLPAQELKTVGGATVQLFEIRKGAVIGGST